MTREMLVGVVIPWREQPHRLKALDAVKAHYSKFFEGKEVLYSDSESEMFSRAQSINLGLKYFFDRGFDVVVVNDADTTSEIDSLSTAIEIAHEQGEVVMPYDTYITFGQDDIANAYHYIEPSVDHLHPCSGSMVIPAKVYQEIGGFDENFIGWGPEDQEYLYRYFLQYNKKFIYVAGQCKSFGHDSLKINDQIIKNHEYACKKYPESKALRGGFNYLIKYFNLEI